MMAVGTRMAGLAINMGAKQKTLRGGGPSLTLIDAHSAQDSACNVNLWM